VESQDIKTSLRDYFRILYYWKSTAIVLFLVISLTTVIGTFLMPPTYEAFTLIVVEREPRAPLIHKDYDIASVPYQLSVADERSALTKTQSEIIKSRQILERVVLEFGLDKYFEAPNQVEKAVNSLKERVKVEQKEDTDIIKLSVEDGNAEMSARITNAIADDYVKWMSELKQNRTKSVSGVLTERVEILDKELREVEDKLSELKKKGDVASIKREIEATTDRLADFKAEYENVLADIKENYMRLEGLKNSLKQENGLIVASQMIANPVVDSLKMKLLDSELKRTDLLNRYNKESIPVEGVNKEIDQTKAELNKEIMNVVNSMESDLTAYESRKKTLEEVKDKYSKRLEELSNIDLEYDRLERQIKSKNELYLNLLGRQEEAALTESIKSNLLINIKIVDPAKEPLVPSKPKKVLNTILGCVIGLMCGVGGAFLKEYWDHSLKTVDEIRRHLELPVFTSIPKAKGKVFTLYTPGSPISEKFHTLSTSIQQLCKENGINTLLITSASRHEGKSVVCANLAMSLASIKDKKVLIVDANLRQPSMHKFFELKVRNNLVEMLSQGKAIRVDSTDINNLHLISAAEEISEPSRLLASDAMKEFINRVKAQYDYVIIDSPALISYPDASILGFESEGIIMVIKFGDTNREAVERAKSLLDKSRRKILGAVLNNVEYVIPEKLYRHL